MRSENLLQKIKEELNIKYIIYGNFSFKEKGDDDVDILIRKKDHKRIIQFLIQNAIDFHVIKYYPNQIFITGVSLKMHITDDLYIGGRKVQYLMKTFLVNKIFSEKINAGNHDIINFKNYRDYRRIKTFLNRRKQMKLDDFPNIYINEEVKRSYVIPIFVRMILKNFIWIPFRLLNKHLWGRL